MPDPFIGFSEALSLTLEHVPRLTPEKRPLTECVDLTASETRYSRVDVPASPVSLKDGFAVRWEDIRNASPDRIVRLAVAGSRSAGESEPVTVHPRTALRILSGATIPEGADTVVASEYAVDEGGHIGITQPVERHRNILPAGSDVRTGDPVAAPGDRLTPGRIGLLTAAGLAAMAVVPTPRVALVATGTEIVPPGGDLTPGSVYASNVMTLCAWCRRFGCPTRLAYAADDARAIARELDIALKRSDVIITSGGAWTSRRDWVARVLDDMGWQKIYHRVRMGPGKAAGFGLVSGKPVFILPGGPPSNLMAFLQLALPGLTRMAGIGGPALDLFRATLSRSVGGAADWTQFVFGRIEPGENGPRFIPLKGRSRLMDMAHAHAILSVPEGTEGIDAGETVTVQMLDRTPLHQTSILTTGASCSIPGLLCKPSDNTS